MSDETGITKHQEEVLREIVAAVGDPAATMHSIGERFEEMWQRAEAAGDGDALVLLQTSWGHIEALSVLQGAAINLAAAARELLEVAREERDEAQADLEEIHTAISMGSESHELLADYAAAIREDAEEQAREWLEEDALDYAFQNVDETIDDALSLFCSDHEIDLGGRAYSIRRFLVEKMRGDEEWEARQAALFRQIIEIERELQAAREARDEEMRKAHEARIAAMRAEREGKAS